MFTRGRTILLAGWIVICGVALFARAGDVYIYVSPTGNDVGPGTEGKPFKTIGRARQAVRAKVKAGLTDHVSVLIAKATYRLTEPLVFGPGDGGDDEHMVSYLAPDSGSVVFSGGVEITGWRDVGGGVWAAKLPAALEEHGRARTIADASIPADDRPAFNELFVAGERRTPARHPNAGYLRIDKAVDARRSFLFNVGDIPAVGDANQVTLVYLHDWEITRVAVASVDQASRTLTTKYPVGCKADYWRIGGYEPHPRYFVEGAREFLDAPGEWWLDRTRDEVLYRPMPGEKFDGFVAVAPLAKQLLVVRGVSPDKPVLNLRFDGLKFEHCAWRHEGYRYAGSQAGFHFNGKDNDDSGRGAMTPAVDVQNARGVGLYNCVLQHLGGAGVWVGRGARKCSMLNCTVRDVAGNGIMLGEPTIRTPEAGLAGGNMVERCTIERCGAVYYGAVGIWVGLSGQNYIWHNEIRDLPYTGISVGWMWNPTPTPCKGNLVSDNHIHHVMQILSDGGGIYTLGWQPGTKLTGNWIHDVPVNAGRAESNGMFLDEGTTDLLIENNLIHDVARSPLRFHKAGVNLVKNNVLVGGKGLPMVRYNATPEASIKLEGNSTLEAVPGGEPVPGEQAEAIRKAAGPRK